MAYEVVMSYHLHMPSYFLGTFTEYPWYKLNIKTSASGRIDMGISVDDTVEEKPQDVEVNPYL